MSNIVQNQVVTPNSDCIKNAVVGRRKKCFVKKPCKKRPEEAPHVIDLEYFRHRRDVVVIINDEPNKKGTADRTPSQVINPDFIPTKRSPNEEPSAKERILFEPRNI